MASEAEKADLSSLKINRAPSQYEPQPERSGKSRFLIILTVVAALVVAGYFFMPSFKSARSVSVVSATYMSAGQANGILTASGYIVPQRKAAVASKGTGRLVFLGVEEGDRVKSGQIIARLESSDVQAQLDQTRANLNVAKAQLQEAEADFERAQKEYDRNQNFWNSKVITDSEFEIVKSQYKSSQARVNSAKANVAAYESGVAATEVAVENTIIRAPFDATVLTKNADVGEIVAPFAAGANSRGNVVTLADMTSLQLEADVSESNIERVKVNQPCEITLDAFPEKRYRGLVWKIVPTADRAKATIMTKIKFIDIDNRVLPEMSAKVTFLAEAISDSAMKAKPKITIPLSALTERSGKKVVLTVSNETVKETAILTGVIMGDRVEILGGLPVGTKIVDKPEADLKDGDKITTEKK